MNIASLVLRARPERMVGIQLAVCAIPGAEVHAISHEDGCMIVTAEDTPELSCADALMKLQQLDHVMSVTLAYEQSDR